MEKEELWYKAGLKSIEFIPKKSDVAVFGAGRTVCQALKAFYDKGMHNKMAIVCASEGTEDFARSLGGFKIHDPDYLEGKDYVYIDGADQIDPKKNLIKGGFKNLGDPGLEGVMYREKTIAYKAKTFIVIADSSKMVKSLGQDKYRLPVEVEPHRIDEAKKFLKEEMKIKSLKLRKKPDGNIFVTENGNNIFDLEFDGKKQELAKYEERLSDGPIFASGLFAIRRPDILIIAEENGIKLIK